MAPWGPSREAPSCTRAASSSVRIASRPAKLSTASAWRTERASGKAGHPNTSMTKLHASVRRRAGERSPPAPCPIWVTADTVAMAMAMVSSPSRQLAERQVCDEELHAQHRGRPPRIHVRMHVDSSSCAHDGARSARLPAAAVRLSAGLRSRLRPVRLPAAGLPRRIWI